MQSVSHSDFSGFFPPLPDPLCFTVCKETWRFSQGRRQDLVPLLLVFTMWTSQLFYGSTCHTNTHTAANKLERHKVKVNIKTEMSWKGMPGNSLLIGLPSWGGFHGVSGPFSFSSHSSTQCLLLFGTYWLVPEIIERILKVFTTQAQSGLHR